MADGTGANHARRIRMEPPAERFSDALRALPTLAAAEGRGPRLGRVLGRLGSRAHGTAILLLALPEAVPLPVPSAGAVLGVPLMVISAHLAVFGERGTLPRGVLDWRIPPRMIGMVARRVVPAVLRAERWSRQRLPGVAARERPVGAVCLALSLLLFLPIPLVNVPLAMGLVILAWGLVQRDGAVVAVGLAYTAALLAVLAAGSAALIRWVR